MKGMRCSQSDAQQNNTTEIMSRLPAICLWFQREKETGGETNTYQRTYFAVTIAEVFGFKNI